MKILMTGASGMLASDVYPELLNNNHNCIRTDKTPRLPDIRKLDICDIDSVFTMVQEEKPKYIFHLAAETNVDLCEKEPKSAYKVNTLGTENMALACKEFAINFLYISTAGVFSGTKKLPYNEFDRPDPANIYGDSKLQGEHIVKDLLTNYFIIRAGWMVGGWEIDKKFVYKIIGQIMKGNKELRVVNDKFGSPTFTWDFAANLLNVINTKRYGLYHMTNRGTCSRYDIALKIVDIMGLSDEVKVNPISSDEFPLPAPRADSEMMDNYKLELLQLNNMPHWEDSLNRYIQENAAKIEEVS